jgi:alanine racemase
VSGAELRPAWAEVDLGAVERNTALMARAAHPAAVCAVVKADAYGHGAVAASRAALAGGARWLAVALVEEGLELRRAGVGAPVLVLSEPPPQAMALVADHRLTPTVYSPAALEAASAAARARGQALPVHVKVDTGMHRVGAGPELALELATRAQADPWLELEGLWTHLAVAEDPADPFTEEQLGRLGEVVSRLERRGGRPALVHAANTAGALAHPASRLDMVRCGISLYGYLPSGPVAACLEAAGLPAPEPALSLKAKVCHVRRLSRGERVSYGRRYQLAEDAWVATVPLGYADGVPRRLFEAGGQVLVGGRRRPLAGVVTMDQLMVDCGADPEPAVGDEVVLLGRQGSEAVWADEWARRCGTIAYEVLCGIGARVPRRPVGSQA